MKRRGHAHHIGVEDFGELLEVFVELGLHSNGDAGVRNHDIGAAGGRIELAASPGQGTRFTVRLPLTTALTQVVLVKAGARICALPAVMVEHVEHVYGERLAALLTDTSGRQRSLSVPPGAIADRFVDELRAAAERDLPAAVAEVVVRAAQPFVQVVVDAAVSRMAYGRICLIGDGAFTVRPHTAAATAKAAADGWALARCLAAADGDVDAALAAWEPGQLELGARLLARARDLGERSQFGEQWDPRDVSVDFGLYGPGW